MSWIQRLEGESMALETQRQMGELMSRQRVPEQGEESSSEIVGVPPRGDYKEQKMSLGPREGDRGTVIKKQSEPTDGVQNQQRQRQKDEVLQDERQPKRHAHKKQRRRKKDEKHNWLDRKLYKLFERDPEVRREILFPI